MVDSRNESLAAIASSSDNFVVSQQNARSLYTRELRGPGTAAAPLNVLTLHSQVAGFHRVFILRN